jgi:hypothetical protein
MSKEIFKIFAKGKDKSIAPYIFPGVENLCSLAVAGLT